MQNTRPLLICDFDGTLCITHEAICTVMEMSLSELNVASPSRPFLQDLIGQGIGLAETFQACIPEAKPDDIAQAVLLYRKIYNGGEGLKHTRLFDGIEETLPLLAKANARLVLTSNKGQEAVERALSHFALTDHFHLIVGEQKHLPKKPAPDLYTHLISLRFEPEEHSGVYVIGDTLADLEFARNIGAQSIWASYGYGDREKCSAHAPDHTLEAFGELPQVLGLSH